MNIIDIKQINKGSLILAFSIEFPSLGLTIRDVKLMNGKNGHWVSFPSREYIDAEGKKKFYSYVNISDTRKVEFSNKCMDLLKPHLFAQPQQGEISADEVPF
jgi:DNA-binding cell septation regulator SpoVG